MKLLFSKLVNISNVLSDCDVSYCIAKKPEHFPEYRSYSDLDIVCSDRSMMCDFIVGKLSGRTDIEVRVNVTDTFTHIDIHEPGNPRLDIKFDLIDCVDASYKKTLLNRDMTEDILQNRVEESGFYFPAPVYEMLIRMLEYREYIDARPDKVKHLHYVNENIEKNPEFVDLWESYVSRS